MNPDNEPAQLKYNTVEEAVKAYKEVETLIGKKDAEMKEKEAQYEAKINEMRAQTAVPDAYQINQELGLDAQTKEKLDSMARNSKLSQEQYNKLAEQLVNESKDAQSKQEAAQTEQMNKLKEIPDYASKKEKINTFIDQNYSKAVAEVIKDKINDPQFFEQIWNERNQSNQSHNMPTTGTIGEPFVQMSDLAAARQKHIENPHILEYHEQYLNLVNKMAAQNGK